MNLTLMAGQCIKIQLAVHVPVISLDAYYGFGFGWTIKEIVQWAKQTSSKSELSGLGCNNDSSIKRWCRSPDLSKRGPLLKLSTPASPTQHNRILLKRGKEMSFYDYVITPSHDEQISPQRKQFPKDTPNP